MIRTALATLTTLLHDGYIVTSKYMPSGRFSVTVVCASSVPCEQGFMAQGFGDDLDEALYEASVRIKEEQCRRQRKETSEK